MTKIKIISTHFLMTSIFLLVLIFLDNNKLYLAIPILFCLWVFISLFMYLWRIDCQPPIVDIGILCALITTIYTVYPIINFWVGGMEFGALSDGRLASFSINSQELFYFELNNIFYLMSFSLIYALVRKPLTFIAGSCQPVPISFLRCTLFTLITLYVFIIAISFFYQTSFLNPSYDADIYDSYTSTMNSLPLLLRQIINKVLPLLSVCKLAFLFYLVSRIKNRKIKIFVFFWILFELVITIVNKGGRSGFIFLLISLLLYYHCLIKKIDLKYFIYMSIIGLLGFNFLGVYRAGFDFDQSVEFYTFLAFNLSIGNEFQSMLGTAYDVYLRKMSGVHLPIYLYFNDFMAVLPPQQLLPFEKISASEWYLRELGISGTGQGYMWGVVSQSLIGGGWLELCLRGGILAIILAKYHNFFIRNQHNFLVTFFYLYFCVKIYYTYRDTTLAFLPIFLWEVIPFYFLQKIYTIKHFKISRI